MGNHVGRTYEQLEYLKRVVARHRYVRLRKGMGMVLAISADLNHALRYGKVVLKRRVHI